MPFRDTLVVDHTLHDKYIEIVEGDLTKMVPGDDVDVLVVSAFPGNHAPTRGSVIGALDRKGVSVRDLSTRMQYDLREHFSCWLSERLAPKDARLRFKRILCFEPGHEDGGPSERVDNIFRALAPFIGSRPPVQSVAMALPATGDQGVEVEDIVKPLVRAAVHWMRTSPLHRVRVYERSPKRARRLKKAFAEAKAEVLREQTGPTKEFDVFLSYASENKNVTDLFEATVRGERKSARIFRFTDRQRVGSDYRVKVDRAIRQSHRFVALLSPEYMLSKHCQDEFNSAWSLHDSVVPDLLFPIRIKKFKRVDPRMKHLEYLNCISVEPRRFERATKLLMAGLPA